MPDICIQKNTFILVLPAFTFEGDVHARCTGPLEKWRINNLPTLGGGGGGGGLIYIVTFISHPLSGVLHHRSISPLLKMYVYSVYIEISVCSSWLLHTCTVVVYMYVRHFGLVVGRGPGGIYNARPEMIVLHHTTAICSTLYGFV